MKIVRMKKKATREQIRIANHWRRGASTGYNPVEKAVTVAKYANQVSFLVTKMKQVVNLSSSHFPMRHIKATTNEEHIAQVSTIKNTINVTFPDMVGSPAFPESLLYPPGRVKAAVKVIVARRIATNDVLLLYFCVIASLCLLDLIVSRFLAPL